MKQPIILALTVALTSGRVNAESSDWAVDVRGQPVAVHTARVNDPPFADSDAGGAYAFAAFDLTGPQAVRVRCLGARPLTSLQVRPESAGATYRLVAPDTIEIHLRRPCQLSIEPDGKRKPLLLFANPPEQNRPQPGAPGVIYFGPGRHQPPTGRIELGTGQTLYLADGAIVEAGVVAYGTNIVIRGRGILDGTPWPWRQGPTNGLIGLDGCRDVTIDGIICRGSPGWTIVPRNCDGVTVANVKICGGRVQNDDGINPCNSRRVRIRNCFIRTDDDCIALKGLDARWGDVADIRVEQCVLWCDRARVTLLGHESRAAFLRDVGYRDLDVIHFAMPVFLLEPGEEMRLERVRFEDIRINGDGQKTLAVVRPTVNQYMRTQVPGHIRDVLFRNVRLTGRTGEYAVVVADRDETHRAEAVRFENVTVNGRPVVVHP